jgi:hypothetical protein
MGDYSYVSFIFNIIELVLLNGFSCDFMCFSVNVGIIEVASYLKNIQFIGETLSIFFFENLTV